MTEKHECENLEAKQGGYGAAVGSCYERENDAGETELWVANGEYTTQVNYCPFCGYEAQTTIEEASPEKDDENESSGSSIPTCENGMNDFVDESDDRTTKSQDEGDTAD